MTKKLISFEWKRNQFTTQKHNMQSLFENIHPLLSVAPNPFMTNTRPTFIHIVLTKIVSSEDYLRILPFLLEENKNKNKFITLDRIFNNPFVSAENKEFIFTCFQKAQKIIHAFYRGFFLYTFRKAVLKLDKDLLWNDIQPTDKNTIVLLHAKAKYLFTLRDLIHIIEKALTHTDNFFCHSLECKNPFNNLPFTKSNLYNIYFALMSSHYKMSVVFHQYFLCHFDLELFEIENDYLIREYAITRFIQNTSTDELYSIVQHLIFKFNRKIKVDDGFPKDELVTIMKPYIYLYMIYTKHITGIDRKEMSKLLLKKLLSRFYYYNPNFGKKMYLRTLPNRNEYHISYNTVHLPMTIMDIKRAKYNFYNMDPVLLERRSYAMRPANDSSDFFHGINRSLSPLPTPLEDDFEESMDYMLYPSIDGFDDPNQIILPDEEESIVVIEDSEEDDSEEDVVEENNG